MWFKVVYDEVLMFCLLLKCRKVGVFVTFTAADEKSATQKMENDTIDVTCIEKIVKVN